MGQLSHFDEQRRQPHGGCGAKAGHGSFGARQRFGAHAARNARPNPAGANGEGDVLAVARLAGIMAAKQTSTLIPLCHPLGLEAVNVDFQFPRRQDGASRSGRECHGPHGRGNGGPDGSERGGPDDLRHV